MFDGFATDDVDTGEAVIHLRRGGAGPPVLLLHGYPQTHVMWHLVAPLLARDFTVVAPDLRGYGDSSKPPTTPDHEPYSKRAWARDQVAVMERLGFERFAVAGHDRGARCAYRMALDHPDRVERVAVLDVIPTADMYRRTDMRMALGAWHWFLLPQPYDLPERLLAADPEGFYFFGPRRDLFAPEALAEYERCLRDPRVIHAICEDYRAGATIDFELDEADRGRNAIACPLLALWGETGPLGRTDVLATWRAWARDVRGAALPCGHHVPEEAPAETYAALRDFLAAGPPPRPR